MFNCIFFSKQSMLQLNISNHNKEQSDNQVGIQFIQTDLKLKIIKIAYWVHATLIIILSKQLASLRIYAGLPFLLRNRFDNVLLIICQEYINWICWVNLKLILYSTFKKKKQVLRETGGLWSILDCTDLFLKKSSVHRCRKILKLES